MELSTRADFEITLIKTTTKSQMLKIVRNKYHQLLQKNKINAPETHPKTLEGCMEELNNLKSKVQELKLEKDGSIKHTKEWSHKHRTEVQENDTPIEELKTIKELKEGEEERKSEENQIEEEHLHRR